MKCNLLLLTFLVSLPHCSERNNHSVTIGFVGDVMLGRMVNERLDTTHDYRALWSNVLPLLAANDLNIANLENAFTKSEKVVPKVFNFKADPRHVRALTTANINVVNLANNHIRDFSDDGLYETIDTLDRAGIRHVGAGRNASRAQQPLIIKIHGITFGIIGCTDNEPGWNATPTTPGTHYSKIGDVSSLQPLITKLRPMVDYIILSIHWGPNMLIEPLPEIIDFAHQLIDAGVDIIHGHSAHLIQGIELYRRGLIMYDTGDCIDDYYVDPSLRNDQSMLVQFSITKRGIEHIKIVPLLIKTMRVSIAPSEQACMIIKRMQKLSQKFGTTMTDDGTVQIPTR